MKKLIFFSSLILLSVSCVKTKGEISMTYEKATAVYGDLDSLRSLPLLIQKQELVHPRNFYIGSNYVLVSEENKGIHIYDNTDMHNPQRLSFIQLPFLRDFYVKDNFLYAAGVYDLAKINISNVYNPVLVSRAENVFWTPLENNKGQQLLGFKYATATDKFEINSPEAKEIKKAGKLHLDFLKNVIPISEIPTFFTGSNSNSKGTLNKIAVEYDHVYVIEDNEMHIISNGAIFTKLSSMTIGANTETIYSADNRLYLGSMSSMTIYNVNNPSSPHKMSSVEHAESCDPVLPRGEIAYYTLRSTENEGCNGAGENTLNLVDISDVNKLKEFESIDLDSPYGLCFANNYLFVGEGNNGLTIYDASNPKVLKNKVTIPNVTAFDIMVHPNNPDILILSNTNGIQEFQINWTNLTLSSVGKLMY
ncbi:MAG: LVIVD repeat-containing protein [Bacteroidota bacterium]